MQRHNESDHRSDERIWWRVPIVHLSWTQRRWWHTRLAECRTAWRWWWRRGRWRRGPRRGRQRGWRCWGGWRTRSCRTAASAGTSASPSPPPFRRTNGSARFRGAPSWRRRVRRRRRPRRTRCPSSRSTSMRRNDLRIRLKFHHFAFVSRFERSSFLLQTLSPRIGRAYRFRTELVESKQVEGSYGWLNILTESYFQLSCWALICSRARFKLIESLR